MLVHEASPGQSSECGEKDKGRIKKDQTGLSNERIVENDKSSSEGGGCSAAPGSLQRQKHCGYSQDTADSGQQAHRDVWNTGLEVILANILEVEVAIEAGEPARQGNQKFCEGRVNVHKESALDVLGRKATEMDLVKDNTGGLLYPEQAHSHGNNKERYQQLPIGTWQAEDIMVLHTLGGVAPFSWLLWLPPIWSRRSRGGLSLPARIRFLAQMGAGRRPVRHGGGVNKGLGELNKPGSG